MKVLKIYIFCSLFLSVVFLLANTGISTGDEGVHNSNQRFEDPNESTNDEAFDTEEEFEKIIRAPLKTCEIVVARFIGLDFIDILAP